VYRIGSGPLDALQWSARATSEPVTVGDVRSHGCRDLCVLARPEISVHQARPMGRFSPPAADETRSGQSQDWLKFKNPNAVAVKREAEEEWNR
jgi:hypothetical protein